MKLVNRDIAILFFSRSSCEDANQKQWFSGKSQANLQVARCLSEQISEVLKKTGLAVFHFHEGNQVGSTFGERLTNAFQEVFHLGYDGVIAVGNDTPELVSIDVNDVAGRLAQGDCVLGPSLRGGAYLIGLTKKSFNYHSIRALPWKKAILFESFCDLLRSGGHKIELLAALRDVNSFHDLLALLRNSRIPLDLKRVIKLILIHFTNRFPEIKTTFRVSTLSVRSLRAPPALYSIL
ncbi:MAG: DUF2064 domain-containing protein [Bacteroidota bacterium]